MTNTYYRVQSRKRPGAPWVTGTEYLTLPEVNAAIRVFEAGQTRIDFQIVKFETTIVRTVLYSDQNY